MMTATIRKAATISRVRVVPLGEIFAEPTPANIALAEALQLLASAKVAVAESRGEQKPQLVKLAVKIAEKILRAELATKPERVAALADAAIAEANREAPLSLCVHPADIAAVEAHFGARLTDIALVADEKIERGGCIIEWRQHRIDTQLSAQLAAMQTALGGDA